MLAIDDCSRMEHNARMSPDWIKSQLELRRMTQDDLAGLVEGMTPNMLSKSLNGHRKITLKEGDAIRRALGYLVPGDPKLSPEEKIIVDALAKIDAGQRPAVVLYLQALTGVQTQGLTG